MSALPYISSMAYKQNTGHLQRGCDRCVTNHCPQCRLCILTRLRWFSAVVVVWKTCHRRRSKMGILDAKMPLCLRSRMWTLSKRMPFSMCILCWDLLYYRADMIIYYLESDQQTSIMGVCQASRWNHGKWMCLIFLCRNAEARVHANVHAYVRARHSDTLIVYAQTLHVE